MFRNYFLCYIVLYALVASVFAVEHGKCRKEKSNETELAILQPTVLRTSFVDNHISEDRCSIIRNPKLVINPYKKIKKEDILRPKNVSSLCLRCGTCLAIADKVRGGNGNGLFVNNFS